MRRYPPIVHKVLEYAVALLLGYVGIHGYGAMSTVALGAAAATLSIALAGPAPLCWRPVLGPRARRVADGIVGAGCLVAVAVERRDVVSSVVLALAGLVLLRLAANPAPGRAAAAGPEPSRDDRVDEVLRRAQPTLNAGARLLARAVRSTSRHRP